MYILSIHVFFLLKRLSCPKSFNNMYFFIFFLICIQKESRTYQNKFSTRRTLPFLTSLHCHNMFVLLRYGHSLSAGRNLSFLAMLRNLRFPSLSRRSRVPYAPFHPVSKLVFPINKKPERLKVRNSQSFRFIID